MWGMQSLQVIQQHNNMESLESDDEMVVVIIGDDEDETNESHAPISPITVKQETIDDDVEKILETATTHGEFLNFERVDIKEERQDDYEYVDDWDTVHSDRDEDYIPQDEDDEHENDEDEYSGNEDRDWLIKQRHRMLKPKHQKSFVQELRDQYPELKKDSNALVNTLTEIMRNVKAPPPPRDYFLINGIMFECVECEALSETIPSAARHYQEKHGERYLVCYACGVDFRSTTNLYKHEKRCMSRDAVIVLKARARALGRKGRARPFLPTDYPDATPNKSKKGGDRKFGCSMCPARFVSKSYLQSHEMLHKGIRPHRCTDCTAAYTSMAALSRHRKTHSDEQYVCDHCGRVFKIKTALVTHLNTHLPVKKFGCDRCTKRYATKAALVRHVDSQHLRLPPPCLCKICYRRFPRMSVLREHMKKVHGLLLMTRRMFFKSLPKLSNQTTVAQAKVVLKSELEPDNCPEPSSPEIPEYTDEVYNENSIAENVYKDTTVDNVNEENSIVSCVYDENSIVNNVYDENIVGNIVNEEDLIVTRIKEEDTSDTEQSIVLSEEVLHYLQSIQGCENTEGVNYVVIDGNVLSYDDIANGLVPNVQIVMQDDDDN